MAGAIEAIGGPIVRKDSAERIVTAPVLVPGEPDRERHQYRAENIEHLAKSFIASGEIDAMHAGGEVGYPTENYVAPQELEFDDRTVPAGAWMLSTKITDDEVWQGVTDGTYQGLSVFGPIRRVLDGEGNELDLEEISRPVGGPAASTAVANSFGSTGIQRELPAAPIGTHWTVELERATHVSIVDDPAVQAASFVVAKSASGGNQDHPIMDDEFEKRFDTIETAVEKSAEAAEAAAESAEEAQSAAEQAVESDGDGDGGDGGDGGGSNGLDDDLKNRLDELESKLDDVDGDGGDGGGGGGDPDFDIEDSDLDSGTIEALTEAGAIDEDTAEALGAPTSGVEKRLAAIEKSLNQQNSRQGFASQLDSLGEDGEESGSGLVGSDERAAAIKNAGAAGGQGGDGE